MKLKLLFAAIIAVVTLAPNTLRAQCTDSCDATPWSNPFSPAFVELSSGCAVAVTYKYRTCTATNTCEFYFTEFCIFCCPGGTPSPTVTTIVGQVARAMFDQMFRTLCPNTVNVAVRYPFCWKASATSGCYEACVTSPCCKIRGAAGSTTPYTVPAPAPLPPCSAPCVNVCP